MQKSTRWTLAGAAVLLIAGAMAIPWSFSGPDLNGQIARQLSAATGLPARVDGRITFALLPSPQLKFRSVFIGEAGGPVRIEAAHVKGKLRLLPLIAGRFEVAGLSFQSPLIRINADAPSDWRLPDHPVQTTPLTGAIVIADGRAIVTGANGANAPETVDAINATMNWRGLATPAAVSGQASWRGQTIDISALIGKPADALGGRSAPFTLEMKSQLGQLRLDGELSLLPRAQFRGASAMTTNSAGALLKWANLEFALATGIERIRAAGTARILSNSISLSGLALDVNDNQLTGTLTLLRDGDRPSISGTLASKSIVLEPRGTGWNKLLTAPDGDWSRELLPLTTFNDLDFDIRLSTNLLRISQIVASDTALTAMAKDGRVELSLSSARSYSGALKARLSIQTDADLPRLRAQIQFEKVDMTGLSRDALATQRIAGAATGDLEFRTHGYSLHEFVANAQGSLRTSLANGSLAGLDIDRALNQYQKQPLSLPAELRSGRTVFTKAILNGALDGGVLTLTDTASETETLLVRYGGTISLPARSIRIDIDAARPKPTNAAQTTAGAPTVMPQLRLDLTGPWSDPELRLDVEGLISNSAAAAPLLRSLKRPNGAPAAPASAKTE